MHIELSAATARKVLPVGLPAVVLAAFVACGSSAETQGSGASTSSTTHVSSSSGAGGTTGAGGGAADKACSALEKARCQKGDACFADLATKVKFGDETTCEARTKLACLAGLVAPGSSATPAGVEACAAAVPGESCSDVEHGAIPVACEPAAGAIPTGGPCGASAQCQSTYCAVPIEAVCGLCAPPPVPGDLCGNTAECGHAGLVCVKASGRCAQSVALGSSCDKEHPCFEGASCVGAPPGAMGVCKPDATTLGAPCDATKATSADCDHNLGLVCDSLGSKACAAIAFVAPGAPCGLVQGVVVGCTKGAACAIAAGKKEGVCTAPAADGGACGGPAGTPCLAPAKCVVDADAGSMGACALPDPASCK